MTDMDRNAAVDTTALLNKHFKGKTLKELLSFNDPSSTQNGKEVSEAEKTDRPKIDEVLVRIIIGGCQDLMSTYGRDITYTQLRNIFQIVKDDRYKSDHTELLLAIPKLAYYEGRPQAGRNGTSIIRFIREMAWKVESTQEYLAFEEIMNTLVAYHKIHGKN